MRIWIALLLTFAASNALAGTSLDKKITFRDHTTLVMTQDDVALDNEIYIVTRESDGKPISIKHYDVETHKISFDASGELGCVDLTYDTKLDQLLCTTKMSAGDWYIANYQLTAEGLEIVLLQRRTINNDGKNKTVTLYKRKNNAKTY